MSGGSGGSFGPTSGGGAARDTGEEGTAGMGVEFVRLSDPDRDAILALVTRGSHG